MDNFRLEVGQRDSGQRLDRYLAGVYAKKFSRSFIQKLISGGHVLVGRRPAKRHRSLKAADVIDIKIPEPVKLEVQPENIPLEIVYEDGDLLVVNKPAGLVVHPAPGHYSGTLVNGLLHHFPELQSMGEALRPGIVHRLDKDTSRILVVAKTQPA